MYENNTKPEAGWTDTLCLSDSNALTPAAGLKVW